MKKIVVIPSYMPQKELLGMVEELNEENFGVIVVDDGSGQDYQKLFARASLYSIVLSHKENKGKGEALKTGFRYIKEHFTKPYIVICADGDGQHTIQDIHAVANAVEQNPDTLVLGSRKLDRDVPFRSQLGNKLTRWIFCLTAKTSIYDTQTGLPAFSHKLIDEMISIKGSRYEYEMDVLMTFVRKHLKIQEVWIETIYLNDNESSHFNVLKDSFRIYKEIAKYSFPSLCIFIFDFILFCLLYLFTNIIILSNILARMISVIFNLTVIKRKDSTKEKLQYIKHSCFILLVNSILLEIFVLLGMNSYLAKLIVEFLLCVLNCCILNTSFKKEMKLS